MQGYIKFDNENERNETNATITESHYGVFSVTFKKNKAGEYAKRLYDLLTKEVFNEKNKD